jgi:hypothetical protein
VKNLQILFMALTLQANLGITACFAESPAAAAPEATVTKTKVSVGTETPEEEEAKAPKNYGHGSTLLSSSQCKIHCTAPHAACSESAEVLHIVQGYYKSLSEHDFDAISKVIDEHCTKFDQASGKLIVGRAAILEDIKRQLEKAGPGSKRPLLSFTIDHPYAHVSGDNAVVTFTAFKEFGGEHPQKYESRCTDIFKREGNSWMKISYRSNWKEINL